MTTTIKFFFFVLLTCWLAACSQQEVQEATENGVYYWRTEWRLDSTERAFLREHDIRRLYCRYFDVVIADGEPMPNATITFSDSLPKGIEVVPTVYVTEEVMHQKHEGLAAKIADRIRQMNETNDIAGVSEIQIDCDYTARSRQNYYDFLDELKQSAAFGQHFSRLSATIRLHQLQMAPPPVDYGVLMLYNTGDPRRFMERNPILDLRDVQPYVRYLADYELPMAAAYPVYRWLRTLQGIPVEHVVEADEILSVKKVVERQRHDLRQRIVTYHLDKENINRYDETTYEAIYHH